MVQTQRSASLNRAEHLKGQITDYLEYKRRYEEADFPSAASKRKQALLDILKATPSDWEDYRWQLNNRFANAEDLAKAIHPSKTEFEAWKQAETMFRFAISPYYLSLIDATDPCDPLRLQSVPTQLEFLDEEAPLDPMNEEGTNPAGCVTRRYPDRLILNVTNECAMYCRHCQRRRNIGASDRHASEKVLSESIAYVRDHPEIRDVLVTGGDPLTMNDDWIESILSRLRAIPTVEIIRIGTRTPVTLPMRITETLCRMLSKYHPIYVNTQFNHPREITPEAKIACARLADHGIPIGNQSVLLNGVNNEAFTMRLLCQKLLEIRVRPYYLFHAKTVRGTTHFQTSIEDGLAIMAHLRGFTSGLAIPTYIVNAPGGWGKIPLYPNVVTALRDDAICLKTWEGRIVEVKNHATIPFTIPEFTPN